MASAARTTLATSLRTFTRAARPAARQARYAAAPTVSATRFIATTPCARADAVPSSSPSPSFSAAPSPRQGQHLFSPPPSTQLSVLRGVVEPLGALPNEQLLDEELAAKALTHKSGVDKRRVYGRVSAAEEEGKGQTAHNEKLAFIGRRVLRLHLTTHLLAALSSSPSLLASSLSQSSIDAILDTKTLGASVGKAWTLEDGLRWREVKARDGSTTGLWKCRGTAVEAVVGAVYTTQGIATTTSLFTSQILPHLVLPRTLSAALSSSPSSSSPVVDDVARPSVQEATQA
ncbi:hypothetical protein JCM10213_003198 [Rhodosporidiobolus nylandii]